MIGVGVGIAVWMRWATVNPLAAGIEMSSRTSSGRFLTGTFKGVIDHEEQVFRLVRFFEQASSPEVHDLLAQLGVFASSQEDDGRVFGFRRCSKLFCQPETITTRNGDIQKDQIGMLPNGH